MTGLVGRSHAWALSLAHLTAPSDADVSMLSGNRWETVAGSAGIGRARRLDASYNATIDPPGAGLRLALVVAIVGALTLALVQSAAAAPSLAVSTITWNVIGLDSNKVDEGPARYPVGTRACNTGDTAASNVVASFVWDTANTLISLVGPASRARDSLEPGTCADFYFQVALQRDASIYDTTRGYHVEVSADGVAPATTPLGRELYVERLVSQNRNEILSLAGPSMVVVGGVYTYSFKARTAPGGYEQLEHFAGFPAEMFDILSVESEYTQPTGATNDGKYADACGWDSDPASANYLSCVGPESFSGGKAGDEISATYVVRVIGAGTGTLEPSVYDFSGSSFHYNADFPARALTVTAVEPAPGETPPAFPPAGCTSVTLSHDEIQVGVVSSITVQAADASGAPFAGAPVTVEGGDVVVVGSPTTASDGRATLKLLARRPSRKLNVVVEGCSVAAILRATRSDDCTGIVAVPETLAPQRVQRLRIRVRAEGKAVRFQNVVVRGPGVRKVARTNRRGVAVFKVRPRTRGIVRISVRNAFTCATRIGVVGTTSGAQLTG